MRLAKIGAAAFVVWALAAQIGGGFFDPFLIVFTLAYAASLRVVKPERRRLVLAFTVVAFLTIALFLTFAATDLTHPESAGAFIPMLFVILALAMAAAGGLGVLRRWPDPKARIVLSSGLTVFLVGLVASLAISASTPSLEAQPGDVSVIAKGFAWEPETVTFDPDTAGGLWIDNQDLSHHTLALPDLGIEVELPGSKARRIDLGRVPAGEYEIICTVPGHQSMVAILEVAG